jgi:uncharacterized protein YqgV (UPF0045/DUF77 family)
MDHRKVPVEITRVPVSIDAQLQTIVEFIQDATQIIKEYEINKIEKIRKISLKRDDRNRMKNAETKSDNSEERRDSLKFFESILIFPEGNYQE